MKNPFKKSQPLPVRQPPQPKKQKCRIRFKKKGDEEVMEFSPECRSDQIEMAKQMREERRNREEE